MENLQDKNPLAGILKSGVWKHVVVWLIVFLLFVLEDPLNPDTLKNSFKLISFILLPVYTHFYVMDRFLIRKKVVWYLILLFIIVIGFGYLDYLIFTSPEKPARLIAAIMTILIILVLSTAVKMGGKGIQKELKIRELRTKHVQTELKLLKAQISPHFLFNTLNNLFVMAGRNRDPKTAEGISGLAQLMRYMLYETDTEFIELTKEAEQINRFIELQKLRFMEEDEINIEFRNNSGTEKVMIAPMLLIPFVENAFKHSVSLQQPTVIDIDLKTENKVVTFNVVNTVNRNRKNDDNSASIGLKNVKRRLELLYPDAYTLNISEEKELFKIELKINTGKNNQ